MFMDLGSEGKYFKGNKGIICREMNTFLSGIMGAQTPPGGGGAFTLYMLFLTET